MLEYRAPAKLLRLLCEELALTSRQWSVLDLGCGTGLMGQAIAPHATELVGVDLSVNMLDKARQRNIYIHDL